MLQPRENARILKF
jgi:hypothetical protein